MNSNKTLGAAGHNQQYTQLILEINKQFIKPIHTGNEKQAEKAMLAYNYGLLHLVEFLLKKSYAIEYCSDDYSTTDLKTALMYGYKKLKFTPDDAKLLELERFFALRIASQYAKSKFMLDPYYLSNHTELKGRAMLNHEFESFYTRLAAKLLVTTPRSFIDTLSQVRTSGVANVINDGNVTHVRSFNAPNQELSLEKLLSRFYQKAKEYSS